MIRYTYTSSSTKTIAGGAYINVQEALGISEPVVDGYTVFLVAGRAAGSTYAQSVSVQNHYVRNLGSSTITVTLYDLYWMIRTDYYNSTTFSI